MTGVITNEHLEDIERAFDSRVLREIFDQYASSGHAPSERVCEALGRVYGKTAGEVRAKFDVDQACELPVVPRF